MSKEIDDDDNDINNYIQSTVVHSGHLLHSQQNIHQNKSSDLLVIAV